MSDPYAATNRRITVALVADQLSLHDPGEWLTIVGEAVDRAPALRARREALRMSLALTPHFSVGEFRCHDGTPYPPEWIDERLRPLCAVLETIREACDGRRVTILSGYRTPAYNEGLRDADGSGTGVAKRSQHLEGRAADIAVDGLTPSEVCAALRTLLKAGRLPQLGGYGLYTGWVHVDVRPKDADGHVARWLGAGVRDFPA